MDDANEAGPEGAASEDGELRPEIARSWRRSAWAGVRAAEALPEQVEVDPEHRLLRAAAPVLDRVAPQLDGSGLSLVLTDAHASILTRRAGSRRLDGVLDDVGVAPGFSYAEDVVGTNGMGTAAEERRAVRVVGEEHFAENLRELTCVGVPIIHPVSGVVEGVLDVTCFTPDASPVLLPLVMEAVRDVQARLADATSVREHLVLEHFLRATRRTTRPVVAVGEQVVMTNGSAARLLGPDDHTVLWEAARAELAHTHAAELALALTDGHEVRVRCRGIRDGGSLVGATLALEVLGGAALVGEPEGLPGLVGASQAWMRLVRHAHHVAAAGRSVVISGPPGAGKAAVGEALHALRGGGPVEILDVELLGTAALDRVAASAAPVLLRGVDRLGAAWSSDLARSLDRRPGSAVLATAARPPEGALARVTDQLAVPGLDQRRDDLPVLAAALLERRFPGAGVRASPAVLQALQRSPWAGNVRELDQVLAEAGAGRRGASIEMDDLPSRWRPHAAPRPLTAVERAECEAIVLALREAGGNKIEAARALGLARSTLYRKLAAYGIDASQTGF